MNSRYGVLSPPAEEGVLSASQAGWSGNTLLRETASKLFLTVQR
jgi:hypothetical protein